MPGSERSRSNSPTVEHHASNAEESRPTTPMSNASSETLIDLENLNASRTISRQPSPAPTLFESDYNHAQQGAHGQQVQESGEGGSARSGISISERIEEYYRRRREYSRRRREGEMRQQVRDYS